MAKAALSPLIAYIGGPDGDFVLKDRAFWAGETVRKAVVLLNDRDDPATISGRWELCDREGGVVLKGTLPETRLVPGEIAPGRVHLEFRAPEVRERTDYVLKLHGEADCEGSLKDFFSLTVFPSAGKPSLPGGIAVYLYDPVGDTRALLGKTGISYRLLEGKLPPPEASLLIIGRNALRDPGNAARLKALNDQMTHDLRSCVSRGLRVLIFEQAQDNLWGLNTELTRWRRSFPCAPGHPVLAGLGEADFTYLRGESDLIAAYPPVPPMPSRMCIDRYPKCGNDNVLVTYSIVRPQKGACRALLTGGFDLQETPLLEVAGGQGLMVFCQIDVTKRYGTDPVSTRLVNNLLTYLAAANLPRGLGKPTDLVREGWEDYDVEVKKEEILMADKPEGKISWGISAADLFFQSPIELPVIQGPNGRKCLYTQLEGEKTYAHLLNRRNFKTKWQKMKAMQIRSALTINQGNSSDLYPSPFLHGDKETLYPMEWLEGFVHPYLLVQW